MALPSIRHYALGIAAAAALGAPALAQQQQAFPNVGKHEPITMLAPSTPWMPAFTSLVEQYETQTGNKVKLDINPFGGVLDKARNDLRGGGGTYDVVMLDTQWTIEMYEGGFLAPLK
jgi:multiple sugar transport system substrate-binding protein